MKRNLLALSLFFVLNGLFAQQEDAWVYFKDKPSASEAIANPLTIISQRALDRRERYGIAIDLMDVPIENSYINGLKNVEGIDVLAKSKWLNAMHIRGFEEDVRDLLNLNYVDGIEFASTSLNQSSKQTVSKVRIHKKDKLSISSDFNYGYSDNQIMMLKGDLLHQEGFTGAGMQIAVIDAGFVNVNNFSAFQRIRENNQILGGYDFVNRSSDYFTGHYHGMSVLSTIAGYVDNNFVGTAPDAKFYLFITEDDSRETPLEESLWVEAAETADSLGVDVINTSLGYSTFDNPNYDHSYSDLDGQSTFISRGAEIAFSRGMILVNSAGNEGNDPWHYINAPADAASVLSVGAVDPNRVIAPFSSYGPTSDGRIKPDVDAQGASVYIINPMGIIATSNGTSFSSPVLAGLVTCLWQAFPELSNIEIIELVRGAGHLFNNPTNQEGYGIPNFKTIYNSLNNVDDPVNGIVVYPNPTDEGLQILFPDQIEEIELLIFNNLGQQIFEKTIYFDNPFIDMNEFVSGWYLFQLKYDKEIVVKKIIKK